MKGNDPLDDLISCWTPKLGWPRGAIIQPLPAFRLKALDPLARRPLADACGSGSGLLRLPAQHRADQPLSTNGPQLCILTNVQPVLLEETAVSQPQLPRSGPD